VKKSLESLYKRVDKHFTEEEGLLQAIWRGIQEEFCRQLRKYEELTSQTLPGNYDSPGLYNGMFC
jgi:hypothetical protein